MTNMHEVHIINGPNLNLLGLREKGLYGDVPFESFLYDLTIEFPELNIHYFQSNHEGALIDYLQSCGFDNVACILNAGGYTHTSIALADTVRAITAPVVEVHLTNIEEREDFRRLSYLKDPCIHTIMGKGLNGYREAIIYLTKLKLDIHNP